MHVRGIGTGVTSENYSRDCLSYISSKQSHAFFLCSAKGKVVAFGDERLYFSTADSSQLGGFQCENSFHYLSRNDSLQAEL